MEEVVLYERAFHNCLSIRVSFINTPRCGPKLQAGIHAAQQNQLPTSSSVYHFYCLECRNINLHPSKIYTRAIFQQKESKSK